MSWPLSFCAYNTGVGWRNIIEKMKANATVAEWYKAQGRHSVHARNKDLELPSYETPLTVKEHELALRERDETAVTGRRVRKLKHLPIVS